MAAQAREYHWDFARALYLLLGIPFHAAVVYSTHHVWPVSSPEPSPVLTFLADMLHTFRMPGFFILAGYFAMMMIGRKGPGPWLASRFIRLGVPLVAASLTILPFQIVVSTYSETVTGAISPTSFLPRLVFRLTHFDEPWISHLWFLYALISCSAALAFLVRVCGLRQFRWTVARLGDFAVGEKWLSFSVLAFVAAVIAWTLPHFHALGGRGTEALVNYNQYAVYFAFGVVLYLSGEVKAAYGQVGRAGLAVALVVAAATLVSPQTVWSHALILISGVVAALAITGFVAREAARRFGRPNRHVKRVVDASFTIYLFHHPVIFVLALVFAGIDWPPVLEFALIVPAAAIVSYLIHLGIAKSPLLLFLFNGVERPRPAKTDGIEALPARL